MAEGHGGGEPVDVVVLGAGIVGVASAISAQGRGLSTILVDRREPGRETSYGNAGILSSGSFMPLNTSALWASLPKYLTNGHPALRWRLDWSLGHAGWIARFLANAVPSTTEPRAVALEGLIRASLALHRQWIPAAGVGHRIRETGWLKAWRGDAVAAAEADQAVLARFGVASEVLDRQAISALEPDIVPVFKVGLLHKDTASVDSPGSVVTAYAGMYAATGGEIRRSEIMALENEGGGWRVTLSDGTLRARQVVVALGPWSADLLRPLGYRVPLAVERGYHREFRSLGRTLRRPIHDSDTGYIMTPMENGIRVTTGVELAFRDAPSSFSQLDQVVPVVRSILDLGEPVGEPWRGSRPTLPDSLPMIGAAPRHKGLWLAFGHQHIGFTTGPATGAAIAAMIAGERPSFDVAAFAPARYL